MKKNHRANSATAPACAPRVRQGASVLRIVGEVRIEGVGDLRAKFRRRGKPKAMPRKNSQTPRPANRRAFKDFPASSRARAMLRKRMLQQYFAAVESGAPKNEAERNGQAAWMLATGEKITSRTVRIWAKEIERKGGIEKAANETFLDSKSCEHPAARKRTWKKWTR